MRDSANKKQGDESYCGPNDLFRLRFLLDAHLAPQEDSAVYAVAHVEGSAERVEMWLVSLGSHQVLSLSQGPYRDQQPRWSPDGRTLAFRSDRIEKSQLYLFEMSAGSIRAITDLPQGVEGGPEWAPDGRKLVFTARPGVGSGGLGGTKRTTRTVFRFDGLGYLDDEAHDIWIVDVESGEIERLTADGCHNTCPLWSPDGQEILYLAWFCLDSYAYLPLPRIVDLRGQVRDVVDGGWRASSIAWHPSGDRVLFVGAPQRRPHAAKSDLWIVDRDSGVPECRTDDEPLGIGGLVENDMPIPHLASFTRLLVQPDGAAAYAVVQNGGKVVIHKISLQGPSSCQPVVAGNRSCIPYDVGEKQLLFGATTFDNPPDLFVSGTDGSNEKQLTRLNAAVLKSKKLARVRHLQLQAEDDTPLEGWLLEPPIGIPPYPTVLYIHGGRHAAWGHAFCFDHQMLAAAGYAVLLLNYRGSRGYGDDFATSVVGDWGNHDVGDLMTGVNHVVSKGLGDPDRLGVCGASAGGTLTAWIVSHTDLFKAAVSESLIANWASAYGTSDIGPWWHEEEFGGTLHETLELAIRNSVISHAHRCRTPTLIVLHEEDYRCPAEQAEQFYSVLRRNGCVVEMLRLPASSHGGSRMGPPLVRRLQNHALLDWMNRYVHHSSERMPKDSPDEHPSRRGRRASNEGPG